MTRPTTMALGGMVVTPHYLASQAGLAVLQEGGNALEATIAAAAAVAVLYPHANSVGGDNFWLIHDAARGCVRALNASGRSGSLATLDYYAKRGLTRIPARGYSAAVTVPGTVSGWDAAYKYSSAQMGGTVPWPRLLEAAAGYAGKGFPVSANQAKRNPIDFNEDDPGFGNIQRFEDTRNIFCNAVGKPLGTGEVLVQADLAAVLDQIAQEGAGAFYRGDIAARIVDDIQANDGVLTRDDFRDHTADWVDPIKVRYRGFDAYNIPPNSQGMAALEILNILNNFDLGGVEDGSADYYHLLAEATKEAFADRDRWLTDPAFVDIPLDELLSPAHGRAQADRIRGHKGATPSEALVTAGDTVWIGVVDGDGNAVSLIQSICDGFGSGVVPKGTGVVMQNRGKYFALDTVSANRLEPRKRTFHTLTAAMLMDGDKPRLVYGTMGGEGQPQTQAAMVTRIMDFGQSPQQAIEAPRWLQGRFLDTTQTATQLHLESRIPAPVVEELRRRGHTINITEAWSDLMGHAGAILIDPQTSVLHGGADPRGDGAAVGF